jgi:hypothetical protein
MEIDNFFESVNAMQCNKCGELLFCDASDLEEHLEECAE